MTGNPIRTTIIFMVLIGLGFAVYACGQATNKRGGLSQLEKLAVGEMAKLDFAFRGEAAPPDTFHSPNFSHKVNIADFRGKTVILNLWATWCAPCEQEMPSLAALQSARDQEGIIVLALSVDDLADREFAADRLEQLSGGVLHFFQAENLNITYSLGATGFPTTIIYDTDSNEVARLAGDADWAGYEAIAFIDQVLGE